MAKGRGSAIAAGASVALFAGSGKAVAVGKGGASVTGAIVGEGTRTRAGAAVGEICPVGRIGVAAWVDKPVAAVGGGVGDAAAQALSPQLSAKSVSR